MFDLLEAVQDQERSEAAHESGAQRRAADYLQYLRTRLQERSRHQGAYEVSTLQAGLRVQDMQARSDHAGEPGSTSDLAPAKGEGRLSHLRQDLRPEEGSGSSPENSPGYPAVLLPRLRQDLLQKDRAGATPADSHRQEAVYLRHLRANLCAETRAHLPQEATSRTAATVARNIH